jgi:hypothetical protein
MVRILFLILISISLAFSADWVKAKESVIDNKNHLQWQDTQSVQGYSDIWKKSRVHCKELNLAGHNDWRLPTKSELVTLGKATKGKSLFTYMKKEVFWTSEGDVSDDVNAFTVYSGNGFVSSNDKCDESYAICVRDDY